MAKDTNKLETPYGDPLQMSFFEDMNYLVRDFLTMIKMLTSRRRFHLYMLVCVQTAASFTEALSLGAIIPFLTALSSPEFLFENNYTAYLISYFELTEIIDVVILFSALFAIIVILSALMRLISLRMQARISAQVSSDLIKIAYGNIMSQGYPYHLQNSHSHMMSTILYDFNVAASIVQQFLLISAQVLLIAFIIISLILIEPIISLVVGGVVIINYAIVSIKTKGILKRKFLAISDGNRNLHEKLNTSFGAVREIILANQQQKFINDFSLIDRPIRLSQADVPFIQAIPKFTMEFVGIVALTSAAVALVLHTGSVAEILPVIGAIAYAANRLMPAAHQLYTAVISMRAAHVSIHRTLEAMTVLPEKFPEPETNEHMAIDKEIVLDNVSFSYQNTATPSADGHSNVLENISASIAARKVTALVGTTGCGKTTLANVIMGLLPKATGNIYIDGEELTEQNMLRWRGSVSHVPQDVYLLDGSIEDNIVFGSGETEINQERLRQSIIDAQLDDFVASSANGLNTMVGERGVLLSGGQRQRLAISRALYNRASLIVLDEATSALDNATEKAVVEATKKMSSNATIIVIAHRLQTIQQADNILVMNAGRIVGSGSYEQLMDSSQYFRQVLSVTPDAKTVG